MGKIFKKACSQVNLTPSHVTVGNKVYHLDDVLHWPAGSSRLCEEFYHRVKKYLTGREVEKWEIFWSDDDPYPLQLNLRFQLVPLEIDIPTLGDFMAIPGAICKQNVKYVAASRYDGTGTVVDVNEDLGLLSYVEADKSIRLDVWAYRWLYSLPKVQQSVLSLTLCNVETLEQPPDVPIARFKAENPLTCRATYPYYGSKECYPWDKAKHLESALCEFMSNGGFQKLMESETPESVVEGTRLVCSGPVTIETV